MAESSVSTVNIERSPWADQDPPELVLWREVIKLAVNDYQSEPGQTTWVGLSPYQRRYAQEQAAAWVFSPSRELGSFRWCCEWLDVRPETILSRLRPQQRLPKRRRIYALTARLGIEYRRLNDRRRRSVPAAVIAF